MSRFEGRAIDVAVAIAGLALPLSFAPAQWWWLPPFSIAILFLSWQTDIPRVAARRGFLFGAGLFLTGTYWLYHSIHVLGDAPLVLALFLMLALVAVMGLYHALLGYLVIRAGLQRGLVGWLIGMPAAWVLLEW
ncbi:MAG: apolipoprotein N-acyltransferase, partial [Gammaproteobacteria bacterium]